MRYILVCLALSGLVGGAVPAGAYNLIGAGTDSCGTWLRDHHRHDTDAAHQDDQWVLGFLSGIGFVADKGDNPLNGVDADAVWAWIGNYCRANPLVSINGAATAFYKAHPH